ncbi:MAG TPA: GDSL-type esterase/lipase family protein [Syntrophorhabdaceae bacterium]|nr:GDSL-type esterase/lipase family protein [Syntrophorhabdaceae bacterium]
MQKGLMIGYVVTLHLLLLVLVVKTDIIPRIGFRLGLIKDIEPELSEYYETMVKFHERMDVNIPKGAAIFVGDSFTQGLCVTAVANPSVNFGIGGDTTLGVLKRLPKYRSLERARICILTIGSNDLRRRGNEEILKNYSAIISALPGNLTCLFTAVLPVDEGVRRDLAGRNKRVRELNGDLRKLCEAQGSRCFFIDPTARFADSSGNLRKAYHEDDGVHLNEVGYSLFIEELRGMVEKIEGTSQAGAAMP